MVKERPSTSVTESPALEAIKKLPLKRYPELRGNRPLSSLWLSKHCQLVGLLIYLTGDVVAQPCSYCAQGSGIFQRCVIIKDLDYQQGLRLTGGSVNCATHLHNDHADLCKLQPTFTWLG